jgi:endonuclease YncB( thermonuclease family)
MKSISAVISLVLVSIVPAIACAQLQGVVVGVADGDTLVVRIDERVLNVDLTHVDAPEIGQAYGGHAKASLVEVCDAKSVTLDDLGIARNRRVFGQVACDGVDAGAEQVKRGLAWVHERNTTDAAPLFALQVQARAERRGLWSEAAPVPPWEWHDTVAPRN